MNNEIAPSLKTIMIMEHNNERKTITINGLTFPEQLFIDLYKLRKDECVMFKSDGNGGVTFSRCKI